MFAVSDELVRAADGVPAFAWGVGVSGGADSVGLLALLHNLRPELRLHVIHLDHETRAEQSSADAAFVAELATRWEIPLTITRRSELEATIGNLPRNTSARYRYLRLELFRRVVAEQDLDGVLLAHHADDQAETILQRLLRGSGPAGLRGMRRSARIGGLSIHRPLLRLRRQAIRNLLSANRIDWREDQSNSNVAQLRNRVRHVLAADEPLTQALLHLASSCRAYEDCLRCHAPRFSAEFSAADLAGLPEPIAREAARAWLRLHVQGAEVSRDAIERLIRMASDAATPSRQQFPGAVMVRRRGGKIFVD